MGPELLLALLLGAPLPAAATSTDAGDPVAACMPWLEQPEPAAQIANAWNAKGKALHAAGDSASALAAFQIAVALAPLVAEFANNLAFLYERTGQATLAEQQYGRTLELDPRRGVGHANYAAFLLARALEKTPGRDVDRDLALAAEHYAQAGALPDPEATLPCSQAHIAALRGRCDEAVGLREACRKAPQKRQARQRTLGELAGLLGDCRFSAGDYDAARRHYDDAAALKIDVGDRLRDLDQAQRRSEVAPVPEHVEQVQDARAKALRAFAILDRVAADADADADAEAEALLSQADALLTEAAHGAPDAGIVHAARAEWWLRRGRAQEAEFAWARGLNLGIGDERMAARAYAGLGRLYLRWPEAPRHAEAAAMLAEAVRREPTRADLRWDLVQACRHSGQLRRALAQLDRYLQHPMAGTPEQRREALALRHSLAGILGADALPLPGDETAAHDATATPRDRARRLAGDDRYAEAVALLRRSIAAGARGPEIYNDLAQYLHGLGDVAGAIQAWRASLAANDAQPGVQLELGRWLARLGRGTEARRHLARAQALGIDEALVDLVRLDTLRRTRGVAEIVEDLEDRTALVGRVASLDAYLERAAQRPGRAPPEVATARALRAELEQRLRAGSLALLGAVLALAALGLLVLWRVQGGHDLQQLIQRHPDTGPEVQRILAAIRHEVLKHNTMLLTGLVEAIEAGDPDAAEKAAHARATLLGTPGGEAVADQLDGYVHELERLGRARGMRLNLPHRDRAISSLLQGFARIRRVAGPLGRVGRLRAGERGRLLRNLKEAARLLNTDGYEAVRNLLDSLRLLRVDAALLQAVHDRTRREPGLEAAAPGGLDVVATELPVWVLIPRAAFEDILTNLLRNAMQSSLQHGGGRIGLAVEAEVSPITGLERAVFAVRDASPEVLTTEMLRGRYIEEGIGLTADLVARYEGTLDVRTERAPWTKAVVVKLPRAHPHGEAARSAA